LTIVANEIVIHTMISPLQEVKVFAPATLANLGCGYDVLGLAIHGPGDEVIIRKNDSFTGIQISTITGDDKKLPLDAKKNTASIAAQAVLSQLQIDGGFDMEIHKKMPFGSGLGSSAASAVAGAFAMNEILGSPLDRTDLLPSAMEGEAAASKAWHADNVAPGLLGGICLIRDNASLDVVSLPVPDDLWLTVLYNPNVEILTSEAREKVPSKVSTQIATTQAGHLAAFVSALHHQDYDLMARAMVDHIAEPGRQELIPNFSNYKKQALSAGALAFGISGSGPSLFAVCHGELSAHQVANTFNNELLTIHTSSVNIEGVQRIN